MKTFKEWMDKKIKTGKDNVNWGVAKQPRDCRLTDKVPKPERQPQVEESAK